MVFLQVETMFILRDVLEKNAATSSLKRFLFLNNLTIIIYILVLKITIRDENI